MCYPLIQRTLSGLARAVRPHISLLAFLYYSERTTARPELWVPTADCWPHQATYEICVELMSQCWLAHLKKSTFATNSVVTYKHTDKKSYDVRKKGRTFRDIGCG